MKLFVWCDPYRISYGSSMVFAIAETEEQARKEIAERSESWSYGDIGPSHGTEPIRLKTFAKPFSGRRQELSNVPVLSGITGQNETEATMNPLNIHIANLSEGYQLKLGPLLEKQAINIFGGTRPRRPTRPRAVNWLSFELIVLALTLAGITGITGMLLGMVLRNAFGGTP